LENGCAFIRRLAFDFRAEVEGLALVSDSRAALEWMVRGGFDVFERRHATLAAEDGEDDLSLRREASR
jgi:hypothetical protein